MWLMLGAAAYLVGWLVAVPPTLRWYMLRDACDGCGHHSCGDGCPCSCDRFNPFEPRHGRAPRGAVRQRTGGDVGVAISGAAFWPLTLLIRIVAALAWIVGVGVTSAVLRTTRLTGPEMERRLRDQQAEIARLTEQIGSDS
jgi:hypothetical protein